MLYQPLDPQEEALRDSGIFKHTPLRQFNIPEPDRGSIRTVTRNLNAFLFCQVLRTT